MEDFLSNTERNSSEDDVLHKLRLEFEFEKNELYEKLLLHKFLQQITTSDQLQNDVRVYASELLSCQEANSLDQKMLTCLSSTDRMLPKRLRPSNFKSTLQKALTDNLTDLKQSINSILSIHSDFFTLSECSDFIKEISNGENKILNLHKEKFELASEYSSILQNYLKLIKKFAEEILLNLRMKQFKQTDEYLQEKINALSLKARVVELQFLTEIYTEERIHELNKLNTFYRNKSTNLESKTNEICAQLKAYDAISGPTFDNLVAEYENLEKTIENKTWALKEFGEEKAD